MFACRVARAALPDAAGDTWVEAKSARFTVYSNAGQQAAVRAARHLERLADVLTSTTQGLRVDGGREVRVYLFRDLNSFKPYRPTGDDENGITAGFQATGPDVALIAYHIPPDGDPMRFASHEYLHAVLGRNLGALPVWVNEGLAEYYSTFTAGKRTADIGRPIEDHIVWLQTNGTIPLSQLMLVDEGSPDYNEGRRRGTVYAESWAMVHMLVMAPGEGGSRFSRFLGALGRGVEQAPALREAYGSGAADSLSNALGVYVKLGSYHFTTYTFASDLADVATEVRELSRPEVLTVLGELAMRSKKSLQPVAREHLETAWRADSSNALAAGLLCEMASAASDVPAMTRWAAAVGRATRPDPRARALAGMALATRPFEQTYWPSWPAAGADANALTARQLLEAANDARPGRVEWQIPYGLTFVEDSASTALGVNALLEAHGAEPHRGDATAGLSMLQSRVGNRAGALVLYQQLRAGTADRAWKHWAGYLLARRTLTDAEKMARAGKEEQAETLLVRLKRDVVEHGVESAADQMIAWMHDNPHANATPEGAFTSTFAPDKGSTSDKGDATGAAADRKEAAMRYIEDGSIAIPAALAAAKRGDFAGAERMILEIRKNAPPALHAGLDSMATEMRNQARMRSAFELLRSGKTAEACALYEQILADHPKPDVREYVIQHQLKYCSRAKTK
jgi:hypothetical protein